MKRILFVLSWFILPFAADGALAVPVGTIHDMAGDVKILVAGSPARQAKKNDPLDSGASVNTGEKSHAVLRFEDGQVIALQSNTQFQIQDYRYNPNNAQQSNIFVSLAKGGLRAITGAITTQNKAAFKLQAPQATIGIRGTDFLAVVVQNHLCAQVISGAIEVQNIAGVARLEKGQGTAVRGISVAPEPSDELCPAAIFAEILAVPLDHATVPDSASGGLSTGALIGIGLGVAGVAAAASGGGSSTTNH